MNQVTLVGLFLVILATTACDKPKPAATNNGTAAAHPTMPQAMAGPFAITVDAKGYHPGSVRAPAGQAVHLVFTRTSDNGCGEQLVFPSLGIRKDLPLNEAVEVHITMPASGSVAFTCGMNMYRGSVVAQ